MDVVLIVLVAVAVLVLVVALKGVMQVPQSQAVVIERFGKYHRTLTAGLNFVSPVIDRKRYVKQINARSDGISDYNIDLREQVFDISQQEVITKDNIKLGVDTLIFYQIVEAHRACYEISDPILAIKELSRTTMRNVFGEMELDTSLSARESINQKLRVILDQATDKWGIKILRVEVQDIKPPEDLKQDMELQMKAERQRRAMVTQAEGKKQAAILEGEGIKQNQILSAQGEAEAKILRAEAERKEKMLLAEGEAQQIRLVQEARAQGLESVRSVFGQKEGTESLVLMEILKSQQEIAREIASGTNQVIYLPTESVGLMGALGGIKNLLGAKDWRPDA